METIVSKIWTPALENEAQLRKLGRIRDPEQRTEVYIEAVEVVAADGDHGVTARDIRGEVERAARTGSRQIRQEASDSVRPSQPGASDRRGT